MSDLVLLSFQYYCFVPLACSGLFGCVGQIKSGLFNFGLVPYGLIWFDEVWFYLVHLAFLGSFGLANYIAHGLVIFVVIWFGSV